MISCHHQVAPEAFFHFSLTAANWPAVQVPLLDSLPRKKERDCSRHLQKWPLSTLSSVTIWKTRREIEIWWDACLAPREKCFASKFVDKDGFSQGGSFARALPSRLPPDLMEIGDAGKRKIRDCGRGWLHLWKGKITVRGNGEISVKSKQALVRARNRAPCNTTLPHLPLILTKLGAGSCWGSIKTNLRRPRVRYMFQTPWAMLTKCVLVRRTMYSLLAIAWIWEFFSDVIDSGSHSTLHGPGHAKERRRSKVFETPLHYWPESAMCLKMLLGY